MKMNRRMVGLIGVLAAGGLLAMRASRADDEDANLFRLPVQHSQDDGQRLWYQPIGLKNATVRFHETPSALSETSQLIDYTMWRDDAGKLERLWFVLRPEAAKWRAAPPGSQADQLPASHRTVYEDLDGDSVFDTMVKVGPESMSSFILFENSWIQVGNSKAKWEYRRYVQAIDSGRKYYFAKGGWKR
jgi:hypothetical protein